MNKYVMTNDGELKHYGVLGMKWGVRRGKVDKAYAKASKKLRKLDRKVEKAENKAYKTSVKADKMAAKFLAPRSSRVKAQSKARRAAAKVGDKAAKAQNWYKSMEKTFKNTSVSNLSSEQVKMGERYADILRSRSMSRF